MAEIRQFSFWWKNLILIGRLCMWFAFKNLVSCDSDIQMIVLIDLPDGSEGVALLLMAPPDAQSSLARFLAIGTGPCWRPFETVPLGGTTTCWGWSSLSASKCSGPSSGMVGWLSDCLECLRSKTCGGWRSAGLVTYATLLAFSYQGWLKKRVFSTNTPIKVNFHQGCSQKLLTKRKQYPPKLGIIDIPMEQMHSW